MTLFKQGEFTSHSGLALPFKIECDSLTDEDIECIAEHIASKTSFGVVQGIPRGGDRLAAALEKYAVWEAPFQVLIVDDVLTSGMSMEAAKRRMPTQVHEDDVIGWCIFARSEPPSWVHSMFRLGD